jgi:predicted membrane-bound spermidine synthase
MTILLRLRVLMVALWLGLIVTLATVAAPTAFALLERAVAGQVAGRMFRIEATVGLIAAMVLMLIERRLATQADRQRTWVPTATLWLALGAMFCTVLGYWGLQPMMEAAREAGDHARFGLLHGLSSLIFAFKGLLLLALLWRISPERAS